MKLNKKKMDPNDYGLFVSGIIFIFLGLILGGTVRTVFIIMGLLFLIVSFVNKEKWKKN